MNAEPIKEIYERFKHLDEFFSDKEWLGTDPDDVGYQLRRSLFDMWQAIKKANI